MTYCNIACFVTFYLSVCAGYGDFRQLLFLCLISENDLTVFCVLKYIVDIFSVGITICILRWKH